MKRIIKGNEPATFIKFKHDNEKAGINVHYDTHLGEDERKPIKNALLKEQGNICAYTLKRISYETSHIEHLKPEELCRQDMKAGRETVSDLDYANMVACFPIKGPKGISSDKYFGAIKKGQTWTNDGQDYILPLLATCEQNFKFNLSGQIEGTTDKGRNTVKLLALDHAILTEERKKAIESFIGKDKPIKKAKTTQAIAEIDKMENGNFIEFCIPIKHALTEHLAYLEKVEKRLKYIRKK